MSRALTGNHLYKTSFSKYGTAYQQMQAAEKIQEGIRYA